MDRIPVDAQRPHIKVRPLGEQRFDADHEDFAIMIATLASVDDAGIANALSVLNAHALRHFSAEDAELRALGGTANECHLDEHQAVLTSMQEVAGLVASGNFEIARKLAHELALWLPHHVEEMDLRLTQALITKRTGGAKIEIRKPQRLVHHA